MVKAYLRRLKRAGLSKTARRLNRRLDMHRQLKRLYVNMTAKQRWQLAAQLNSGTQLK